MPVEHLIESNNTEVKRSDNRTKLFKIEKFQWDEEKRKKSTGLFTLREYKLSRILGQT